MRTRSLGASLAYLLMLLLSTACSSLPGAFAANTTDSTDPTGTPGEALTATPTPFMPSSPTPTSEATPVPLVTVAPTVNPAEPWGNYPAPVEPSAIEVPPPAPRIEFDPSVINILLLGSDARPYTGGYRTDVMMIVSLNPEAGTATLISIPRDLYVYIPGWRVDRINTADPRGGPELAAMTIEYNFGIPIHRWARMNFAGFMAAIDSLGGISVDVTGYLYDECGGVWRRYTPSSYNMDGFTALCYVRMRKASSDFDRLRRQQEVIMGIFNKILTLDGLSRVPDLYGQFNTFIQTDFSLTDAMPLIPLARTLSQDPGRIDRYAIDSTMATGWRVPYSGAAVLLPDRAKIQEMLATAFGP